MNSVTAMGSGFRAPTEQYQGILAPWTGQPGCHTKSVGARILHSSMQGDGHSAAEQGGLNAGVEK